jgi:hypothetical protein
MWKHRTDDDGNVGLGNMTIDPHLHLRIGQQAAGQLGKPGGFDGPECDESVRKPRLVVHDRPARIGLLTPTRLVAKMAGKMFLRHALVGA